MKEKLIIGYNIIDNFQMLKIRQKDELFIDIADF